jgi:HSP20 family protein
MNRLMRTDPLDDFFRGFLVRPVEYGNSADVPTLKIDVKEVEKAYVVHVEIPGVRKEDIHVAIDGAVVSVSAERRQEKDVRDGERVLRSERSYGKLTRSFQLPQDVDESQSVAKYNDGILNLTLPKKLAAQSKRLTIQ